tara:strand:+ start:9698 stop:9919 length:222 start_codon:yes stop_codon:yes gene_type:complete
MNFPVTRLSRLGMPTAAIHSFYDLSVDIADEESAVFTRTDTARTDVPVNDLTSLGINRIDRADTIVRLMSRRS